MAIPKPSTMRPIIKVAMWKPRQIRATPTIMIAHPITTPILRPSMSAVYGTKGMAIIWPIAMDAVSRPRM